MLRVFLTLAIVLFLTVLTQVGGIIYLLCLPLFRWIDRRSKTKTIYRVQKTMLFVLVYLIFSFAIIPKAARLVGRVPLPVTGDPHLKPLTYITCILNRHYVKPALKHSVMVAAENLSRLYPQTVTHYLDANFPFMNGFPLVPHLSHNDGEKLDLTFYYLNASDLSGTNETPSVIGYGVFVDPEKGEVNQPQVCEEQGYWQYGFMENLVPQGKKDDFLLDIRRTRTLIYSLGQDDMIRKIFIEPHLKSRMGLTSSKVRYHGCQAVRHDDHIHIQM